MFKERLKSYDYSLLVVYLLITIFGVIMVYSASMVTAVQVYGYASNHFFTRQLLFFVGSLFILLFVAIFPYKKFSAKGWMMFFVFGSLIVLTILLLAGNNVNNATSWFSIGPISIQPAEFVKLAVIIYMAAVYAKKQPYINDFNTGVIPPILFLVIICFLIFLQPDIGTAGIIFVTGTILVFARDELEKFISTIYHRNNRHCSLFTDFDF